MLRLPSKEWKTHSWSLFMKLMNPVLSFLSGIKTRAQLSSLSSLLLLLGKTSNVTLIIGFWNPSFLSKLEGLLYFGRNKGTEGLEWECLAEEIGSWFFSSRSAITEVFLIDVGASIVSEKLLSFIHTLLLQLPSLQEFDTRVLHDKRFKWENLLLTFFLSHYLRIRIRSSDEKSSRLKTSTWDRRHLEGDIIT